MKDEVKMQDSDKSLDESIRTETLTDRVMIERRYLPLSMVFEEEKMKKILEQAAGSDEVLLRRLKTSRRTFQQVVELFGGYGMDQIKQGWCSQKLDEMDLVNPLPLEEVCEYLKEEEWTLDLLDLGLYNSEIWKGQVWNLPVRKVHKFCTTPNNEDVRQHILILSSGEGKVRVRFYREVDLQAFWKEILLCGRVEVKEGTDAIIYSD